MRKITADVKKGKGPLDRFFNTCVGAGRAGELLRKVAVEQLGEVSRECGFRYLRFHGLLCEDMGVYSENSEGVPAYNFQYIDMVYDEMLAAGVKPFVELGFMPKPLATGEKTVFWWKANVTPPKSYEKWYDLIRALTEHWTARYGKEEVKTWLFEVWNEPNHPAFFSHDLAEYLKIYDTAAKAVKDVCEEYQVGGPATAGNAWIPEMIAHCLENKVPLDFVSTHTYGVFGDLDEFGEQQQFLVEDQDCIITEVEKVYRQVKESPLPNLPIHYTEWSASYSSRDPVHDSYVEATYILYNIKRLAGMVDSMSYWTFTDVFEEAGPGPKPFHGGFGMLNLQSLRKPAFYAYQFLNRLGGEELANADSDSIVCKNEEGVQALVWQYTHPKQEVSNQKYFTQDLKPLPAEEAKVELTGLEPGRYQLTLHQVGYRVNDIYTECLYRGFTDLPTREEVAELKKLTGGDPVLTQAVEVGEDGTFTHMLPMRQNDCYLLLLNKRG